MSFLSSQPRRVVVGILATACASRTGPLECSGLCLLGGREVVPLAGAFNLLSLVTRGIGIGLHRAQLRQMLVLTKQVQGVRRSWVETSDPPLTHEACAHFPRTATYAHTHSGSSRHSHSLMTGTVLLLVTGGVPCSLVPSRFVCAGASAWNPLSRPPPSPRAGLVFKVGASPSSSLFRGLASVSGLPAAC